MRMGKSLFKTKKRHLPNQRLDPSSPPKKKNAHLNWWRVCFSLKVTPIQIHPKTPNNQRPQPDSVVGVVAVGPPAVVRGSSFLRIFSGTMSNLDKSWRSARERERDTEAAVGWTHWWESFWRFPSVRWNYWKHCNLWVGLPFWSLIQCPCPAFNDLKRINSSYQWRWVFHMFCRGKRVIQRVCFP